MSRVSLPFVVVVILCAGLQSVKAELPLQLTMDANSIWIRADKSPILQYRYHGVPFKPYVKELYSPGGVNVLLDAPADHLHHHGLMFAVAADGTNFWEETPTAGRQSHLFYSTDVAVVGVVDDSPFIWRNRTARIAADVPWWRSDGPVLMERRTIEVSHLRTPSLSTEATALAWESELAGARRDQPIVLTGSHYFGLGMRFPHSMDSGEFLNADATEGTIFRGEERLVRSNWCAYRATPDGKPVTVAMFGHPDNPREPVTWFTMARPFAYMSATLALHEQALEVLPQKPLTLRYCVVVWDGHILPGQIDAFYNQWAAKKVWKPKETPVGDRNGAREPK